jgi:gliding motility-associated-like protein
MHTMRWIVICLAFAICTPEVMAQSELVPNGDFESYSLCPTSFSCIEFNTNTYVDNWLRPSEATSDFFHSCASEFSLVSVPTSYFFYHQPAHSGEAYGGFYVYYEGFEYREYLQVQLTEPMVAGQCYYIEYYTAPSETNDLFGGAVAIDRLGLHIGVEREVLDDFADYGPLDVVPQIVTPEDVFLTDTMNWIKVSGVFVAEGGEEWITIGNFLDDVETNTYEFLGDVASAISYYAVDDVSITPLTGLNNLPDTVLCAGETLILETAGGASSYTWNTGDTTASITVLSSGTYIVTLDYPCGTFSDTAVVIFNSDTTEFSTSESIVCSDELPYLLTASDLYTTYLWSTGETTPEIFITEPGTYYVQGYAGCATYIDTFSIMIYDEIADVPLPDTILICDINGTVDIFGPDGFDTYTWSTGETTQYISVTGNGIFTVTYSKYCDTYSHTYQVITDAYLALELNLPETLVVCPFGNPVAIIDAEVGFPEYNWNTGENTAAISVSEPGVYIVTATTLCRTVADSTMVSSCQVMTLPNAFTPNGDGVNDLLFTICNPCDGFLSLTIYNRWGEPVFETSDPGIGWDGTFNGESAELGAYSYVLRYNGTNGAETLQGSLMVVK